MAAKSAFAGLADSLRRISIGRYSERASLKREVSMNSKRAFGAMPEDVTHPKHYNVEETSMRQITVESIPITVGREDDGRWWADIESMLGVMAYGATREAAVAAVRALALRVAADCIDHGEEISDPFTKLLSVA
jgi:predicted RNase H-like HicB family nuclease